MGVYSNHYKYQLAKGLIDLSSHIIKAILMNNSFTFDKDAHATYANVSASELGTNYGYTVNDKVLTGKTVTEDDTNDMGVMTADNVEWTASGGSIGPTNGILFYDDDTSDNTVIGYQAFTSAVTAVAGEKIIGSTIRFEIG